MTRARVIGHITQRVARWTPAGAAARIDKD